MRRKLSLGLVLIALVAALCAACGLSPGIDLPTAGGNTGSLGSGGSTSGGIDTDGPGCGGAGGETQRATSLAGAGGEASSSENASAQPDCGQTPAGSSR